jgi:hypothetical protein
MSKIDLFKTVDEFNSNVAQLNTPSSLEITEFKLKHGSTKALFDELNVKTQEAVNVWKEIQLKVGPKEEKTPVDHLSLSRAKLIKNASLGILIMAAYTSLLALEFLVVSSAYLSAGLWLGGAALITATIYRSQTKAADKKAPSIAEKGEKAIRILLYTHSLLLNQFEGMRQRRLLESQNFKKFVEKFVQAESKVDEQSLLNKKLHALYLKYKFSLKEIFDEKIPIVRVVG